MDTKVDVVVVSKNPVTATRNLWISDGLIPINEVIVETSTPLAKARQRAIEKVTTDWFVFLDDDILLPNHWWSYVMWTWWGLERIHGFKRSELGAFQGTAIPYGLGDSYDLAYLQKWSEQLGWWQLNGNSRMYTHNTLIRTEAVRDWNPPDDLSSYEDLHMMRHIMKRGYKVFVVKTETYHKYSWAKLWPMGRWGTRGRLRFFPRRDVLKDFLATPYVYLTNGFRIGTVNAVKQTAGLYELVFGGR